MIEDGVAAELDAIDRPLGAAWWLIARPRADLIGGAGSGLHQAAQHLDSLGE